jgi:hypothetical protein
MLLHTILVDKFRKYKFGQKTEHEEGCVCVAKIKNKNSRNPVKMSNYRNKID